MTKPSKHASPELGATAQAWLHYEAAGARLRLAHRCVEWDGWEEGLVEGILGPAAQEEEWFKDAPACGERCGADGERCGADDDGAGPCGGADVAPGHMGGGPDADASEPSSGALRVAAMRSRTQAGQLALKRAREREQTLTTTGDICGGRGGELGRRLEAWLSGTGHGRRRSEDVSSDADA